jgi:hypothetical protein
MDIHTIQRRGNMVDGIDLASSTGRFRIALVHEDSRINPPKVIVDMDKWTVTVKERVTPLPHGAGNLNRFDLLGLPCVDGPAMRVLGIERLRY